MGKESEMWRKSINKLKTFYKRHRHLNLPSVWRKDKRFSRWMQNIREYPNRLSGEQVRELQLIGFDFTIPSDWNAMFNRLEEFHGNHGHCYVPADQKELEELFDWTINQKKSRSLLTLTQLRKLDSRQFDWETSSDNDIKWGGMYRELVDFKRRHGHVRVPYDFKENKALGNWVARQRKKGTDKKLSEEKIKQLNQLGFLWKEDVAKLREQAWEKRFNELRNYKIAFGHMDRLKIRNDNYSLGLWIETQMNAWGHMLPYRKKKLNAIGFKWEKEDIYEQRWNEMYQKLIAYRKRSGHCQVKRWEDFRLSVWLQRHKRDKDKLPADKRKKLERVGIKWAYEHFNEIWGSKFKELKEFQKKNGHLNVPKSNKQLYEWIQFQKERKSENRLSKERSGKLSRLGFFWKGEVDRQKKSLWESMHRKFKMFQEKYGSRYILKLKEDPELNEWVNLQLHSKEKLSAFKKEKLKAIDFPWNRGEYYSDQLWETMFEQLADYKNKFGHCDVPQKYSKSRRLAHWVNSQRTMKLSGGKIDKLSRLGFSWAGEIAQKRWQSRVNEFIDLRKKDRLSAIKAQTPLHSWIYQQKKNFPRLSIEKRKILLKVGIFQQ